MAFGWRRHSPANCLGELSRAPMSNRIRGVERKVLRLGKKVEKRRKRGVQRAKRQERRENRMLERQIEAERKDDELVQRRANMSEWQKDRRGFEYRTYKRGGRYVKVSYVSPEEKPTGNNCRVFVGDAPGAIVEDDVATDIQFPVATRETAWELARQKVDQALRDLG